MSHSHIFSMSRSHIFGPGDIVTWAGRYYDYMILQTEPERADYYQMIKIGEHRPGRPPKWFERRGKPVTLEVSPHTAPALWSETDEEWVEIRERDCPYAKGDAVKVTESGAVGWVHQVCTEGYINVVVDGEIHCFLDNEVAFAHGAPERADVTDEDEDLV